MREGGQNIECMLRVSTIDIPNSDSLQSSTSHPGGSGLLSNLSTTNIPKSDSYSFHKSNTLSGGMTNTLSVVTCTFPIHTAADFLLPTGEWMERITEVGNALGVSRGRRSLGGGEFCDQGRAGREWPDRESSGWPNWEGSG